MGILVRADPRLLRRAIAASLAVHLFFAVFVPNRTAPQSTGEPIEALSFAHVMRAHIERPATAPTSAAPPATTIKSQKVTFARQKRELTTNLRKPQTRPTAQAGPIGNAAKAGAPHRIATRSTPLFAQAAASSVPANSQSSHRVETTPAPQATTASQQVASSGASDRGGELPFGAAQTPVLDPNVRERLQKTFSVHVTLLVTVGDDGHTKRVVFQPPIDPAIERQIETILAGANWDAAVCGGGISCEGVATIKL
jgi:hypothetical protein